MSRHTEIPSKGRIFGTRRFGWKPRIQAPGLYANRTATFLSFDYHGLHHLVFTKITKRKLDVSPFQFHAKIALQSRSSVQIKKRRSPAKFSTVTCLVCPPRAYSLFRGVLYTGPVRDRKHIFRPQVRRADTPTSILCSLFLASLIAQVTPYSPVSYSMQLGACLQLQISCAPLRRGLQNTEFSFIVLRREHQTSFTTTPPIRASSVVLQSPSPLARWSCPGPRIRV